MRDFGDPQHVTTIAATTTTPATTTTKPVPVPIELQGRGKTATEPFAIAGGLAIFRTTHTGSSNFIVKLSNTQGVTVEFLVNAIGAYEGSTARSVPAGQYLLNIEASGTWSIKINQDRPATGEKLPQIYDGRGQAVAGPFEGTGGGVRFALKHSDSSNFIVKQLDQDGKAVGFDSSSMKLVLPIHRRSDVCQGVSITSALSRRYVAYRGDPDLEEKAEQNRRVGVLATSVPRERLLRREAPCCLRREMSRVTVKRAKATRPQRWTTSGARRIQRLGRWEAVVVSGMHVDDPAPARRGSFGDGQANSDAPVGWMQHN